MERPKSLDVTDDRVGISQDFIEGLLSFINIAVVPLEDENRALLEDPNMLYDHSGAYSPQTRSLLRRVRELSAEAGYYSAFVPSEIGGGGLNNLTSYMTWETLYHTYGPSRLLPYQAIAHWTQGPSFLIGELSPDLRDKVAQAIMSGSLTGCFAMSEPEYGSDAWSMQTRAVPNGDGWTLTGSKQWISNSAHAEYAFVFAVTDDILRASRQGGISCFFVSTDSPGFAVDRVIRMFGRPGGNEAIIALNDVHVPKDSLVGTLNQGFALALRGVSDGRMFNAGRCVGLARWALDGAVAYSKERKAFGQRISDYQGVSFQLADSAIEIYGSKMMAEACARKLDLGQRAVKELAIVKAASTEMCFRVFDRCIQVHGAMGLTNELRLTDGWHEARSVRIADGTGEVMRRTIVSRLMKGDLEFT